MRYIKYIILSAVLLLAFQTKAQVKAVLSVENEVVVDGNYEFVIVVRTADNNTDGSLYMGNADFVLDYNNSLFTNPTFEKIDNSTSLPNSLGEESTVNLLVDLNLNTTMAVTTNSAVPDPHLIINLNGINPGSASAFMNNVPAIDDTACEYRIGKFRITGLNDPTTTEIGLNWITDGNIPTDVYSYDSAAPYLGNRANVTFADGECATGLPIELISFSGENIGNHNQLYWKTSTEQNSDYFEVQKSADGANFNRIGQVEAAGTSLQSRSYDMIDGVPFMGISYYRLKMVDKDGSFSYSNIVAISIRLDGSIAVFPVPAQESLSLVYDSNNTGTVTINVVDAIGQMLVSRTEGVSQGFNNFKLDISQLPVGAYFINVIDGNESKVRPFIKK